MAGGRDAVNQGKVERVTGFERQRSPHDGADRETKVGVRRTLERVKGIVRYHPWLKASVRDSFHRAQRLAKCLWKRGVDRLWEVLRSSTTAIKT